MHECTLCLSRKEVCRAFVRIRNRMLRCAMACRGVVFSAKIGALQIALLSSEFSEQEGD